LLSLRSSLTGSEHGGEAGHSAYEAQRLRARNAEREEEVMNDQPAILRCSFCNKDQNDVRSLIAGPTVFICNECVEVCNDVISGKYDDNAPEGWIATASPWHGSGMTRCATCGHLWPSQEPGTTRP
jgi:hypothetical protein